MMFRADKRPVELRTHLKTLESRVSRAYIAWRVRCNHLGCLVNRMARVISAQHGSRPVCLMLLLCRTEFNKAEMVLLGRVECRYFTIMTTSFRKIPWTLLLVIFGAPFGSMYTTYITAALN